MAQRAQGKLVFNHDFFNGVSDTAFIYKSEKKRLVSLEMEAAIKEPVPNDCPDVSSSYGDTNFIAFRMTWNVDGDPLTTSTHERLLTFSDTQVQLDALWYFLNWNEWHKLGDFQIDDEGFPYIIFLVDDSPYTRDTAYLPKFRTQMVPAEYCGQVFPLDTGSSAFDVDPMTGDIVFVHGATDISSVNASEGDVVEKVYCFDHCQRLSGSQVATNVLAASAQTFNSQWTYDPDVHGIWAGDGEYDPDSDNPFYGISANHFQRGEDGKWRVSKSYVYRSDLKPGVGTGNTIYDDAGVFVDETGDPDDAFTQFVWNDPDATQAVAWLNPVTVTRYAPSGEAVEEVNVLGISSAAKLAHGNTVPLVVAQNTEYRAVSFTSFEERYIAAAITDVYAHSGRTAYALPIDTTITTDDTLATVTINQQIKDHGILIKLWAKRQYSDATTPVPFELDFGGTDYRNPPTPGVGTQENHVIHHVARACIC
jgi:hypothetical protein